MSGDEKVELITARINEAFKPEKLTVIDESASHVGHAGYQGGGRHFAVEIECEALAALPRVAAHRKVYALFDDMIPDSIHALRISIK